MTNLQIKLAQQDGCITVTDLNIWYLGYMRGEKDCLDSVMKDMNNSIKEELQEEKRLNALDIEEARRQSQIEEDEHYGDYSEPIECDDIECSDYADIKYEEYKDETR